MMNIPDNLSVYESIERDMMSRPNPVLECDWCGEPIFEGEDYLRIDKWDKCVCEKCADEIGVWEVADGNI